MYRKRERTQNWSLEEKKYLLELVKSRLDVLENKRIDSASSAMKGMAWQDIHASFAARFGNDRDAHRVREQWRRMKGQARTEMLEFAERVRTYGAEVANQRWPSSLAEDVWRTLESARIINDYPHGYAAGDDVGSPVILDDEDEDGDDMDAEGASDRLAEDDIKVESVDERYDRMDHRNHRDAESASELMNILRPKVELNDVPDLDHSMVPSGLSITAVKMGSSGQKRRLMERHEAAVKNSPWDSPASTAPTPSAQQMIAAAQSMRASTPQQYGGQSQHQGSQGANCLPHRTTLEGRRPEHRRKAEMLEVEHEARMELLRVEKETADVRLRIALREEANAVSALTCRSCGAERVGHGATSPRSASTALGVTPRRRGVEPNAKGEAGDPDLDNDANPSSVASVASAATQGRLSPPSPFDEEASRGSGASSTPMALAGHANGVKEEDDNNNGDQVRFAGGLGEPGSGAGKGGGSGGSIRDAGGSMGKREAAFEEEYFYKQQKEQLKKLKSDLNDEIGFHEEQIKRHQEAIARHKQRVVDLDKDK